MEIYYEEFMKEKNIIVKTEKPDVLVNIDTNDSVDGFYYSDCINFDVKDSSIITINDDGNYMYTINLSQHISCDIIDNLYVYSSIKTKCFLRIGCDEYDIDTFGEYIIMRYNDLFMNIIFLEKPKIDDSIKLTFRSCYLKKHVKNSIMCEYIVSNNKVYYYPDVYCSRESSNYKDNTVIYYNKFIKDINIINDNKISSRYDAIKLLREKKDYDAVSSSTKFHFAITNIDNMKKNDRNQYYVDMFFKDFDLYDNFSIVKTTQKIKCSVKIGHYDIAICDINEVLKLVIPSSITIVFLEKPIFGDEVNIGFTGYVFNNTVQENMTSNKRIISKNKIYTKNNVELICSRNITTESLTK